MSESCYGCGQATGTLIHVDYCAFTGRKAYPSLGSPNYDQRYGFSVHESCLTSAQKKRMNEEEKKA